MKRRKKVLGDIGPQTRRYQAIRDGIRGVRRALDRKACPDARALLRLTEHAASGVSLGADERRYFDEEKARFRRLCKH